MPPSTSERPLTPGLAASDTTPLHVDAAGAFSLSPR